MFLTILAPNKMNFRRGIDPKESLQIGVEWKAYLVDHIHVKILDPSISDDRFPQEKLPFGSGFRTNPKQIDRKKLSPEEIHRFLQMTSEKRLWASIFELFPQYEDRLRKDLLSIHVLVIMDRNKHGDPGDTGYPFRTIWKCQGETLIFKKKIYSIPSIK